MLESLLRTKFQKYCFNPVAHALRHTSPHAITCLALICGVAIPFVTLPWVAVSLLWLSGFFDVLDGSVARLQNKTSKFGTIFDITTDRLVEFAVIMALFLISPDDRGFPCLLMLGSILLCVTAFLIVSALGETFRYSVGLIERAEAFILFTGMFFLPEYFTMLAGAFTVLVFLTALLHIVINSIDVFKFFKPIDKS